MEPRTEKQRRWADILEDWRFSGLSQTEYCRQRGLNIRQFYSYKSRLAKRTAPVAEAGEFIPVAVAPQPPQDDAIVIRVGSAEILYKANTDPRLLTQLLELLEGVR